MRVHSETLSWSFPDVILKSSFACSFCSSLGELGTEVCYLSTRMGSVKLVARLQAEEICKEESTRGQPSVPGSTVCDMTHRIGHIS
jgi:hypothetical protein